MAADSASRRRLQPRSLLGVTVFPRKYPGAVTLELGLLLVNIAIEMSLPIILGLAINDLRQAAGGNAGTQHHRPRFHGH